MPIERKSPTHLMTLVVPLNGDIPQEKFDAFHDAVRLIVGMSRAAWFEHICGELTVELRAVRDVV